MKGFVNVLHPFCPITVSCHLLTTDYFLLRSFVVSQLI
jgi:hypothetical protein